MMDCIKRLVENIKEFFKYKIVQPVKDFWKKLSRSSRWFVRTWNNYDWDSMYLIQLMVDKMKDMRTQFENDGEFVDMRHQPKYIDGEECGEYVDHLEGLDKAIEIGERILKDDYIQYTPSVKEYIDRENGLFDTNKTMPENVYDEFIECCKDEVRRRKKDNEDFFDTIRDNFELWWD